MLRCRSTAVTRGQREALLMPCVLRGVAGLPAQGLEERVRVAVGAELEQAYSSPGTKEQRSQAEARAHAAARESIGYEVRRGCGGTAPSRVGWRDALAG